MKISILGDMILGAGKSLSENKGMLDNLNVFPIPDGDTGTNMEKTMLGMIAALKKMGERPLRAEELEGLYDGALMAAQGNSGVILSQWFKGLFMSFERSGEVDAMTFNEALQEASQASYNAVSSPVEGTMLTVAREAYEYAEEFLTEETTLEEYLKNALSGAEYSLKRTPDLLPVLKEAGVVDSGGYGFVCILSGMISALTGEYTLTVESFSDGIRDIVSETGEQEFGYCTELILQLENGRADGFDNAELTKYLNSIGNSVIAVQDGGRVKLHVHTLTPEQVLAYCHNYGEFLTVKIDNMTIQHQETITRKKERCAIAAVADGDGTAELFGSMGAKYIIRGGQSDNVSTEKILECFSGIYAEDIIFLPNNDNLVMVAEQAQRLCKNSQVHIVRTSSMAEGYSALSMIDPDDDHRAIIKCMEDAIKGTVTGVVARATRDSASGGVTVRAGQYIGIENGAIVASEDDIGGAMKKMLSAVKDIGEKGSVVVLCSTQERLELAESMRSELLGICGMAEMYFVRGGQEVFDYVFAIE